MEEATTDSWFTFFPGTEHSGIPSLCKAPSPLLTALQYLFTPY